MLRHMKHPKSYISTLIDTELEPEVDLTMAEENFRFDDIYIYIFFAAAFSKRNRKHISSVSFML